MAVLPRFCSPSALKYEARASSATRTDNKKARIPLVDITNFRTVDESTPKSVLKAKSPLELVKRQSKIVEAVTPPCAASISQPKKGKILKTPSPEKAKDDFFDFKSTFAKIDSEESTKRTTSRSEKGFSSTPTSSASSTGSKKAAKYKTPTQRDSDGLTLSIRTKRRSGVYHQMLSPDLNMGLVLQDTVPAPASKSKSKSRKPSTSRFDDIQSYLSSADMEVDLVEDGDKELVLKAVSDVEKRIREAAQTKITEVIRCDSLTEHARVYHSSALKMWRPVFSPLPFLRTAGDVNRNRKLPPLEKENYASIDVLEPKGSAESISKTQSITLASNSFPSRKNVGDDEPRQLALDLTKKFQEVAKELRSEESDLDLKEEEKQKLSTLLKKPLPLIKAEDLIPHSDDLIGSLEENRKAIRRCEELKNELEGMKSALIKKRQDKGVTVDEDVELLTLEEIGNIDLSTARMTDHVDDGYLTYRRSERLDEFKANTKKEGEQHKRLISQMDECLAQIRAIEEKAADESRKEPEGNDITLELRKKLQEETSQMEIETLTKDLSSAVLAMKRQNEDLAVKEARFEAALRRNESLLNLPTSKKERQLRVARLARAQKAIVRAEVFLHRQETMKKARSTLNRGCSVVEK